LNTLPLKNNNMYGFGVGAVKRSFQYDADMNIKSINSSGQFSNGNLDKISHTGMKILANTKGSQKIAHSDRKKRTLSQQRISSAKV
jgi:hypothetical protein